MGKPTGFIEYLRDSPWTARPCEHVRDWREFHHHMDEKRLAARCMDCSMPHGQADLGMASGCPVNNLIPEWNDLVYRGLWREALEPLRQDNNFPEFTGRVCAAPCEGWCVLGINAPPVTMRASRTRSSTMDGSRVGSRPSRPPHVGQAVAVIGPAGTARPRN